jgi:hypothetical protein
MSPVVGGASDSTAAAFAEVDVPRSPADQFGPSGGFANPSAAAAPIFIFADVEEPALGARPQHLLL